MSEQTNRRGFLGIIGAAAALLAGGRSLFGRAKTGLSRPVNVDMYGSGTIDPDEMFQGDCYPVRRRFLMCFDLNWWRMEELEIDRGDGRFELVWCMDPFEKMMVEPRGGLRHGWFNLPNELELVNNWLHHTSYDPNDPASKESARRRCRASFLKKNGWTGETDVFERDLTPGKAVYLAGPCKLIHKGSKEQCTPLHSGETRLPVISR